jgi:hypothetical protein
MVPGTVYSDPVWGFRVNINGGVLKLKPDITISPGLLFFRFWASQFNLPFILERVK